MMSQINVIGAGGIQLIQEENTSVLVRCVSIQNICFISQIKKCVPILMKFNSCSNAPGEQPEGNYVVVDAPGVSENEEFDQWFAFLFDSEISIFPTFHFWCSGIDQACSNHIPRRSLLCHRSSKCLRHMDNRVSSGERERHIIECKFMSLHVL
mgnify:FL=1